MPSSAMSLWGTRPTDPWGTWRRHNDGERLWRTHPCRRGLGHLWDQTYRPRQPQGSSVASFLCGQALLGAAVELGEHKLVMSQSLGGSQPPANRTLQHCESRLGGLVQVHFQT